MFGDSVDSVLDVIPVHARAAARAARIARQRREVRNTCPSSRGKKLLPFIKRVSRKFFPADTSGDGTLALDFKKDVYV